MSAEIRPTHRPLRVPGRRLVVTKNMVETAIANTRSNAEAARWLGITPVTYKKWAGYYGLYEQHKNQAGKGIKKGYGSDMLSHRIITIALLIGIILGYILGHLVPVR